MTSSLKHLKAESISIEMLSNREKVFVVDALKDIYPLKDLLKTIYFPRSNYFYQRKAMSKDKYKDTRIELKSIFEGTRHCYGYRRIHVVMKQAGKRISEKVIRRLMKEESLIVKRHRRRKYSTYADEITPALDNLLNRDFHAPHSN